jgi:2'-5' RNA ligase
MIRLFTALSIPDDVKEELYGLRESLSGARWVSKENMHLTLQFIGEISDSKYHQIKDDLEDIQMTSFDLKLDGVSTFTQKVLYCSVSKNEDLIDLQSMVKEKIELTTAVQKKKYVPHVTLARLRDTSSQDIASVIEKHHDYESRDFSVHSFGLYSSKLTNSGPVYTLENEYELY